MYFLMSFLLVILYSLLPYSCLPIFVLILCCSVFLTSFYSSRVCFPSVPFAITRLPSFPSPFCYFSYLIYIQVSFFFFYTSPHFLLKLLIFLPPLLSVLLPFPCQVFSRFPHLLLFLCLTPLFPSPSTSSVFLNSFTCLLSSSPSLLCHTLSFSLSFHSPLSISLCLHSSFSVLPSLSSFVLPSVTFPILQSYLCHLLHPSSLTRASPFTPIRAFFLLCFCPNIFLSPFPLPQSPLYIFHPLHPSSLVP